jgi:hypothetical protein
MTDATGVRPYTVRDFLDAELPRFDRVPKLESLAGRFTEQPLDATVDDIRTVIAARISMEDYRRLHILISHLYQACDSGFLLTRQLRAEVNRAFSRRGETPVSQPAEGG